MNESKIELTERLRREGRWSEASRFKDEAVKDFRSKGMKAAEAREAAWEATEKAYPPVVAAEQAPESPEPTAGSRGQNGQGALGVPPVSEEDLDALLERIGGGQPPDLIGDTLWAYENLSNRKAKPQDAPSLGAWDLLQWARQHRNRFFEIVLPKAMSARPQEAEDRANLEKNKMQVAEIRRVLKKYRDMVAKGE